MNLFKLPIINYIEHGELLLFLFFCLFFLVSFYLRKIDSQDVNMQTDLSSHLTHTQTTHTDTHTYIQSAHKYFTWSTIKEIKLRGGTDKDIIQGCRHLFTQSLPGARSPFRKRPSAKLPALHPSTPNLLHLATPFSGKIHSA